MVIYTVIPRRLRQENCNSRPAWPTSEHNIYKTNRIGIWLTSYEYLLFLQKTLVPFPAPTQCLTTICRHTHGSHT